ncbi:Excinuclease ABC subunit C [Candidatus Similichlamydia laticola]|uniref:UvrABC system protein C n=2 Tax=Candidatus Similichlamydia laticola TaxID=2170265 RepID=A0A369KIK8_9BACT|nr:Excinuclease ABC subunit C [Candidatus Similichlamydia laticola]
MTSFSINLEAIPKAPGVYLMKGNRNRTLYIGKAIDLRKRISQYFILGRDDRDMIPHLLSEIKTIDFIVVSSEKEALLLERRFIQEHRPKYNACLKDDSSFYFFHFDPKETWPKLRLVRSKNQIEETALIWGPYSDSRSAREILDLLHRVFPLRRCSDQELSQRKTPCLYYQVKCCPAPCIGSCSKEQYAVHVQAIINFLNGKIQNVLTYLEKKMEQAANQLEFEHAAYLRDLHEKIQNWNSPSDGAVDSPSEESADLFGIIRQGTCLLITRAEYRGGRLMHMDHFELKNILGSNEDILQTWVFQYYMDLARHSMIGKVILCLEQGTRLDALRECLTEKLGMPFKIFLPETDPFVSWARLLALNSWSKLQTVTGLAPTVDMEEIQSFFSLNRLPNKIECVDHSHLQGHHSVSSVIVCEEGHFNRQKYRRYSWGCTRGNDLDLLKLLILKRYSQKRNLPDLLLLDGGKTHWQTAYSCLVSLGYSDIPLLALSKDQGKHTKGLVREKIWGPSPKRFQYLDPMSPITLFLQKVRDEAHHVALSFQRKQRGKYQALSVLDTVPGIGPKLKTAILSQYDSLKQFSEALKQGTESVKLPSVTRSFLLEYCTDREFYEDD